MFRYDNFETQENPKTVKDLFIFMVKPYKARSLAFFSLTFIGIVAWSGSPFVVAEAVDKLSNTHHITAFVWLLVATYFVLRFVDEIMWRAGEAIVRSYKPEMVERI